MTDVMEATVYFDYLCPFAYRGVRLFTEISQARSDFHVTWCHFALDEINAKDPTWHLWDQPLPEGDGWGEDGPTRALRAFLASHAAAIQGEEKFAAFRLGLFAARFDEGRSISDPEVLLDVAARAGLNMHAFLKQWQSQAGRDRLCEDHEGGRALGAFGVPTLVVDGCQATYMKIKDHPPAEQRDGFFDRLVGMLTDYPFLQELKRPS